ncbi:MAG: hypothetical protein AB7R55_01025 [Gemmatimonadales bacterium]
MPRGATVLLALLVAAGCRPYDDYAPIANESGLVPADRYARYGAEQAQVIAIGRALAQWHGGSSAEDRATQVSRAAEYARTLPGVAKVVPDTMGYRLTVTFKSGWRTAVVPIQDGVRPEDTPGVGAAQ